MVAAGRAVAGLETRAAKPQANAVEMTNLTGVFMRVVLSDAGPPDEHDGVRRNGEDVETERTVAICAS